MVRKSSRYLLLGLLVLIPGQAFSLGAWRHHRRFSFESTFAGPNQFDFGTC